MNCAKLSGLFAVMVAAAGPALAQGAFVFTTLPIAANAVDGSNRAVGSQSSQGAVWVSGTTTLVPLTTDFQAVNSNGLAAGYGTVPKKRKDGSADYPRSHYPKAAYLTYDIGSGIATMYTAPKGTTVEFFAVGGINNSGVAVTQFDTKAFVTTGDVFTHFKYPKANYTSLLGINDAGLESGSYRDSAQVFHSFTRQGSVKTSFDPPGAVASSATGTTDGGITYGQFTNSSGNYLGYVRNAGSYTTIQYPGSTITVVTGIGPSNEVVGFYRGSNNSIFGFILVNGTYFQIGANGYFIKGVNALGTIVGWTSSNGDGGFIATCAADQFPCTH
jgi:hypothetical protein